MQSKLRLVIVVIIIGMLFYIHENPENAKVQASKFSQEAVLSIKNNLTEDNVADITAKTIDLGVKFSEGASKVVEKLLTELGYVANNAAEESGE